ncbi:hypothetical protein BDB01DRAFT_838476 [Pilobolus umbonatus]|nr:hypothetical protein BDB01DRAFT_838476 [Pilobolus umbonatus]
MFSLSFSFDKSFECSPHYPGSTIISHQHPKYCSIESLGGTREFIPQDRSPIYQAPFHVTCTSAKVDVVIINFDRRVADLTIDHGRREKHCHPILFLPGYCRFYNLRSRAGVAFDHGEFIAHHRNQNIVPQYFSRRSKLRPVLWHPYYRFFTQRKQEAIQRARCYSLALEHSLLYQVLALLCSSSFNLATMQVGSLFLHLLKMKKLVDEK